MDYKKNPYRLYLNSWFCIVIALCLLAFSGEMNAQNKNENARILGVSLGGAALYGGSLVVLNQYWYANYPKSKFHFFNDNAEWQQMDKCGHFFTSYYEGFLGFNVMQWAGLPANKAVWYGGTWGLLMQTPIEIMDGLSSEWGFSWGDELANTLGSALLIAQQYAFGNQLIRPKFSYMPTEFAAQNPNLFGDNVYENIIKDYNGQNYWLSYPTNSIVPIKFIPPWFSISIGLGAKGMLHGMAIDQDKDTKLPHYERYRQYLVSFDVNLSSIDTKSAIGNTALNAVSWIKIPSPTIEYSRYRGFKAHILYF